MPGMVLNAIHLLTCVVNSLRQVPNFSNEEIEALMINFPCPISHPRSCWLLSPTEGLLTSFYHYPDSHLDYYNSLELSGTPAKGQQVSALMIVSSSFPLLCAVPFTGVQTPLHLKELNKLKCHLQKTFHYPTTVSVAILSCDIFLSTFYQYLHLFLLTRL